LGQRASGEVLPEGAGHGNRAGNSDQEESGDVSPTVVSLTHRQSAFAGRAALYVPVCQAKKWAKADRVQYMTNLVATETCEEVAQAVREVLADVKPDFDALAKKLQAGLQQ